MRLLINTHPRSNNEVVYKSPWAALLWSIAIPGFGQFYNRDYFFGMVLMVWELFVNLIANINEMVFWSFKGEL
jgi:TM2 domain-containing membrane protein YozV